MLVDDNEDMRRLLRLAVELADRRLHIQGSAEDGADAVQQWRRYHPDVVVMDHSMPTMTGIEAAEQILTEDPTAKVILITSFNSEYLEQRAARLGVLAVFAKDQAFDHLVPALHTLAS